MAALAELLVSCGAHITGSDIQDEFYTDAILRRLNIPVASPFAAKNIPANTQCIIYSAAYNLEKHVELIEGSQRGLPLISYPQALGDFSRRSYSCGIAGVHGKTTTTAMIGTILKNTDLSVSVLAGSMIPDFGNSCTMIQGSDFFVAETCEYKNHFLHFHPQKILLTAVESDHQDFFPTYESILVAFLEYAFQLPQFSELIYCVDNPGAKEVASYLFPDRPDLFLVPYGETAIGDYRIQNYRVEHGHQYFSLRGFAGEFSLCIPGYHNVLNATGAIAVVCSLLKQKDKLNVQTMSAIRHALAKFRGSKRRNEIIGEADGILFMDDYAHHPTAITATLTGLKAFYPNRRIIVDFMSHTYSRTAALFDEFAGAFNDADELILHKIYPSARDDYKGDVDGEKLYAAIKRRQRRVHYFQEVDDAFTFTQQLLKPQDLFITMGAGDNWKLGRDLYAAFSHNEKPS